MTRIATGLLSLMLLLLGGCSAGDGGQDPSFEGSAGDPNDPGTPACFAQKPKRATPRYRHETNEYRDTLGRKTLRHVFVEPQAHGRSLVLAVDESPAREFQQRVVFRQSFSADEMIQQTKALTDLKNSKTLAPDLHVTSNPLWPIDRDWTDADEADYAAWIHANANMNTLVGSGLLVDCADFAITLRWIYAREHHLPAANSLAGSGGLWGSWQSTEEWDQLPTATDWKHDERFKAAVHYVLSSAYTHTIINDLYPVAIQPDYVTGGTIYLTLWSGDSGHTRTITGVGPGPLCPTKAPCISIVYGSEPAAETGYDDTLVPYLVTQGDGGFLRFRWPEQDSSGTWGLRAGTDMPGYSLEQFHWNDVQYSTTISNRLNLWGTPEEKFVSLGSTLMNVTADRIGITEMGYYMCSLVPCSPSDSIYGDWSTPERDATLNSEIHTLQTTAYDHSDPGVQNFLNSLDLPVIPGSALTFANILTGTAAQSLSSDPRADFFARWGLPVASDSGVRLSGLAQVAFDNFANRANQVYMGKETTRLDQGFRIAQQQFLSLYQSAPPGIQAQVAVQLRNDNTGLRYCSTNACGTHTCSMYDLMIADPSHIQNMSSNPSDGQAARFGF